MTGSEMIAAERQRQMEVEGWTPQHDDESATRGYHGEPALPQAAASYAMCACNPKMAVRPPSGWPWDEGWWKPASPIRMLTKAGALIAAEIDRRLRAGEMS